MAPTKSAWLSYGMVMPPIQSLSWFISYGSEASKPLIAKLLGGLWEAIPASEHPLDICSTVDPTSEGLCRHPNATDSRDRPEVWGILFSIFLMHLHCESGRAVKCIHMSHFLIACAAGCDWTLAIKSFHCRGLHVHVIAAWRSNGIACNEDNKSSYIKDLVIV